AAIQPAHRVIDQRLLRCHHRSAGHVLEVHEHRRREIAGLERGGNRAQMLQNARSTGAVVGAANEHDPATVGQVVEVMGRRILIDAHDHTPAFLHCGKGGVVRCGVHVCVRVLRGHASSRRGCEREKRSKQDAVTHWRLRGLKGDRADARLRIYLCPTAGMRRNLGSILEHRRPWFLSVNCAIRCPASTPWRRARSNGSRRQPLSAAIRATACCIAPATKPTVSTSCCRAACGCRATRVPDRVCCTTKRPAACWAKYPC